MTQRTKRGNIKTPVVLEKLREGRRGAIQVRTEAKINSPAYIAAGTVLDAIDQLASELTGNPRYFHLKQ